MEDKELRGYLNNKLVITIPLWWIDSIEVYDNKLSLFYDDKTKRNNSLSCIILDKIETK